MGKFYDSIDRELVDKRDSFLKNIDSDMHYILNRKSDTISFDWLDVIENACPFIDNIVRYPKVTLVDDERIVEIEKAKKITADSIKDLSKHPNFINDVEDDGEVNISKILDVRKEETHNIYENRFLYTLIKDLDSFMYDKEQELADLDLSDHKKLEYFSTTMCEDEKIDIQIKILAGKANGENANNMRSLVEEEKERIKKVRFYITSWLRSELVKELEKAHVQLINPPVQPTNVILKNPNFQEAVKLWEYVRSQERFAGAKKRTMESEGNQALLGYLDDAFLTSYFVLDSISYKKKDEKEKILKYAIVLLSEEVYRTITLLQANGIDITEEELLDALSKLVKKESNSRLVGIEDIKKKFQSEIDEYLKKAKKGL